MRIQHNITALSAYRNLTNNNSAVAKNLEKLSSGYKINRAGDDAAGLAISEKMRAQITGLETAQKNANDGISLIQTAEGALTEVHSMLNRMVELANQSANGTYQDEDRVSLQSEVTALLDEIDRISKSTNFNGRTLLNGDLAITAGKAASATTTADGVDKLVDAVKTGGVFAGGNLVQVHDGSLGEGSQKLKFSYDLSNTSIKNTSTGAGSAISGDKIAIKVGSTAISLSSTFSLGNNKELKGADLANEIMKGITANGTKDAQVELDDGGKKVKFNVSVEGDKLVFEMVDNPTKDATTGAITGDSISLDAELVLDPANNSTYEKNWAEHIDAKIDQKAVFASNREMAQARIDLADLGIKDGTVLQIGKETYVFAVGKDSDYKDTTEIEGLDNVKIVDLTNLSADQIANKPAEVARAAAIAMSNMENSIFKIGGKYDDGTIGLTEKVGALDNYDEYDLIGGDGDKNATWEGVFKTGQLTNATTTKTEATSDAGGLTLQIGDTSDDFNKMTVGIADMSSKALGLKDIDVSTQDGAAAAVDKIKAAINQVSAQRGDLGALQNRLEHTINSLSVTTENITAAESRIRDVDMAKEMMAYTKNNILVQASQAMLAQANQIPQGVLQLLQ